MDEARCPKCRTMSRTPSAGKGRWHCHRCGLEFEAIDDGDVGRARPDVIAERREAFLLREEQRRLQRQSRERIARRRP